MQEPGTLIEGKYEILSKIREGGMGAIYKVRHRLLDEVRVVKVMRPQILADEELKQRFVEEAKTATRLKHPNICAIYDFALDDDGTAYLVMEYINGVTLSELAHSVTPPGLAMSLEIAHQALLALGYLHRRSVVHRDIAPDNLMLTEDEESRPLVKLIDLGIAKALDRAGGEMTSTGVFLGKLKYASPEQYGALPPGERIDGRSDLYSLGVVLYELLTGTRPFAGETPAELLRAHLLQAPAAFALTDPGGKVPEGLRAALLKALEKKREDRFGSAEDFDREILHIQRELDPSSQRDSATLLLSKVRGAPEKTSVTITPSAQNRLDRQFIAGATPHPGKTTLVSVPRATGRESSARTVVATPPPGSTRTVSPPPGSTVAAPDTGERAPRRPGRVIAAAVLAAAAAAAALLLFVRPKDQAAQAPSAAA
ncbi:MAG TPA: protein kinase, partial [Thermoanaerobaculia bacterium]|nr:protein kinase [Thermoanaerobaculia bacterium]